jgi:serine/threonine protein kinase
MLKPETAAADIRRQDEETGTATPSTMQQSAARSDPVELPERIGGYSVLDVAGSGNMAIVYTGYDPEGDRDVAIKVCELKGVDDRLMVRQRKLFFNEVRTAQLLDHPNIVRVLDSGEQGRQLYLVMEHVGGSQSLSDYCAPDNLLPVEQVAQIAYTVARALDYAHRRGVIHRDIKPSNILLTPAGLLKIADFGVAQNDIGDNTTQVLGLFGSPYYMSPEQVRDQPLTGQTDLYALGVVMFELLTGRRPFLATKFDALLDLILHKPAPSVRELRSEVPEALARIVATALEKDTGRRYRCGREMASDLAAIFGGLSQVQNALTEELRFDLTRQLRVFSEFPDAELMEMLRSSEWREYGEGERLATEAWPDQAFFVLVAGDVTVSKRGVSILRFTRGDCFVELSRVGGAADAVQVTADDDVTLLQVNATALDATSTGCQLHFYRAFVRTLVERLTREEPGQGQERASGARKDEIPPSGAL